MLSLSIPPGLQGGSLGCTNETAASHIQSQTAGSSAVQERLVLMVILRINMNCDRPPFLKKLIKFFRKNESSCIYTAPQRKNRFLLIA